MKQQAFGEQQALAEAAGYEVSPDADQDGLWTWVQRQNGRIADGCDASLESESAAWHAAAERAQEAAQDEAGLSDAHWATLPFSERLELVREAHREDNESSARRPLTF